MSNKKHKIGDMLAVSDDGVKYTVGWITQISEGKYYIVQWADDAYEYPMQYNYNDVSGYRQWYNNLVDRINDG